MIPETLRESRTLGQYELIRALGRGPVGPVFLARDMRLGRLVALKLLAHNKRNLTDEFLAEARATAGCRHENIPDVHDVGEVDGQAYMVLEYVPGPTLRSWLRRRERRARARRSMSRRRGRPAVSRARAVELMAPVIDALVHAHELGIVHGNLTPKNIVLAESGGVKVRNFGISKLLARMASEPAARATDTQRPEGARKGLPGAVIQGPLASDDSGFINSFPYRAPEQCNGQPAEARSDIWAVGVILYELVTGAHPLAPASPERLSTIGDLDQSMPRLAESQPLLGPLAEAIDRCLHKDPARRMPSAAALAAALHTLLPDRTAELAADASPFAGLAAFQVSDAARFFGRDRDIAAATTRLRREPMLTVAGPSGAGKSSFIRAGVIPALDRLNEGWRACIVRPGRRPLHALAAAVLENLEAIGGALPDSDALAVTWRSQPGQLGTLLRARCRRRGWRLVLFVDQFEELYTLCADPDDRATFLACLQGVGDDPSSPLRVILAVRSDFLDRMANSSHRRAHERAAAPPSRPGLSSDAGGDSAAGNPSPSGVPEPLPRGLSRRTYRTARGLLRSLIFLPPMGRDDLRAALTGPLANVGYEFESEDMVEDMLDTLAMTRNPLPLLQFTAAGLWQTRDRTNKLLTRASYRLLGGVEGALVTRADAVIAGLSARERTIARAVFLSLVTPQGTRALVSLAELRELSDDRDEAERVVRHLASAPLVLMEPGIDGGSVAVELIHESLIERWPQLGQWLDESHESAQFLTRLRAAARQWHTHGRDEGLLWRGRTAKDAEVWWRQRTAERESSPQAGHGDELDSDEARYLRAVIGLAHRARRQRRWIVGGAFGVLGLVALAVSYLAVDASDNAARAEQLAARADIEAGRARAQKVEYESSAARARNATRMATAREYQGDPTTVLALVREVEPGRLPRGWSILARWALQSDVAQVVQAHPDVIRWAAFSPDGRRFATASWDQIARVYATDGTGEPLELHGHQDRLSSVEFSPDGSLLATASMDQTVRIWALPEVGALIGPGAPPPTSIALRGHRDRVWSAHFSSDGERLLTASSDGTARVWRTDGSALLYTLSGHTNGVSAAAFSSDGARVATSSLDRTVRVYALGTESDNPRLSTILRGHTDRVYSVRFSPDGTRLVTGSADHTARVWSAAPRQPGTALLAVLKGHGDRVYGASFSPDGQRIATSSADNTVRLWNADGSGRVRVINAHQERVYWVDFSPDGERLISASRDRTVRIWNARRTTQPIVLRGHTDIVYWASLSTDSRLVATASGDGTARVFTVDGTRPPAILRGHSERVYSAMFDRATERMVTASGDHTARIWSVLEPARPPLILRGHDGIVYSAEFSPDGTRVVTASDDHTARVWSIAGAPESGSEAGVTYVALHGHEGVVYNAAFSPDGARVVTASADRSARVWSADGSGRARVLRGHEDRVYSAAFSPDGMRVVTASTDKTARIWMLDGSREPVVLRGHQAQVEVRGGRPFSPDGTRLVTHSDDDTIRIWNADGSGQPLIIGGITYGVNSAAFSADGQHIIVAAEDGTARIVTDVEPLRGITDPKLWSATSYCLSVQGRQRLLDVTEESARIAQEACEERVRKFE